MWGRDTLERQDVMQSVSNHTVSSVSVLEWDGNVCWEGKGLQEGFDIMESMLCRISGAGRQLFC